ncbi:hypothetical protein P9112_009033 [Eukaryota sp. TZLM1-RC]
MPRFEIVKGPNTTWIKESNPSHPSRALQHPVHQDENGEFFYDHMNRKVYLQEIEQVAIHVKGTREPQFEEGEETKEAVFGPTHSAPVERNLQSFEDYSHPSHVNTQHGKHISQAKHSQRFR